MKGPPRRFIMAVAKYATKMVAKRHKASLSLTTEIEKLKVGG
jgi:hypothetical protein